MERKSITEVTEIKPLTFFRFITAFLVFLFHIRIHLNAQIEYKIFDNFILQGAIFMSAFFMLSGFIMYYVYNETNFNIFKNIKNFYIKRIAKIYPSYLCVVVISYILASSLPVSKGLVLLPMSIFCLQSIFYVSFPYLMNGGLWSLSVEAVFYLLFPFICIVFASLKKYYKYIILFCYLFTIYPSVVQYFLGKTEDLYVNPIFRLPEFILGICLSYCYLEDRLLKMTESLFCIGSLVGLIIFISFFSTLKLSNGHTLFARYNYFNFVAIPLIACFLYSLAIMKNKIILRFTNNFICNYLGKISYSFYLTQFVAVSIIGKRYFMNKGILSYIVPFVINIITAVVLYELVERKCRKFIVNRYIKKEGKI